MDITRIAIDGPVGAGKSTIARECAKRLGIIYIDTGAMYRAVGLYCVKNGIDTDNHSEVESGIKSGLKLEIRLIDAVQHVYVNGKDVSEEIRLPEFSMMASKVSAIPCVREFLLEFQRGFAKANSVIMDGRDIGTVVLPDAEVKIFLTAAPEVRAKRRYDELVAKGIAADFEEVLGDLNKRDYNDSHREIAPLKQADDAILVDTGGKNFEESVQMVLEIIGKRVNRNV